MHAVKEKWQNDDMTYSIYEDRMTVDVGENMTSDVCTRKMTV